MKTTSRLRIGVQKSGRLSDASIALLSQCGFNLSSVNKSLLYPVDNYPVDLLFVRDDDIPALVMEGVCDLGIVGENVLQEKLLETSSTKQKALGKITKLNFGYCRLSIAIPEEQNYLGVAFLQGKRIATSYPNLLQDYLSKNKIDAEISVYAGSIEIAPALGVADAICDLVSTGKTLKENSLKEVEQLFQSQAVLISNLNKKNNPIEFIWQACAV